MLKDLELHADGMAKRAIYEGAKITADAIKKELQTNHKRTGALAESVGIPQMQQDKKGNWNTKIGFDGKDSRGVANMIKARALESGTSKQPATPFVRPALNRVRKQVQKVMTDSINEDIQKNVNKKGD